MEWKARTASSSVLQRNTESVPTEMMMMMMIMMMMMVVMMIKLMTDGMEGASMMECIDHSIA